MTKRKAKPPGPAWLADMVIALGSWRASILVMCLSWLWRHWRGVGAVMLAALVFVQTGSPALAGAALVALYGLSRWRPAKRAARWWDHDTLSAALVDAGVLRMVGDKLPTLSYKGKPKTDERGTTVIVGLPQAKGLEDVTPRKLAQALQIPTARLALTQEPDDNANTVRMTVSTGAKAAVRRAAVAQAERTDWSEPIALGVDDRGREVVFTTTQTHSVVAGATGSGKTVAAHLVVAHAALDPRVRLFFIDGKGDGGPKGWAPLEPCCAASVRGMGSDSPARIEALLNEVYVLSEQRGADGDEAPEIVLILEEWAAARSVLARLDRKCAERCDSLVTVLLATARSRGVHTVLIAQRGTATSFPTDQRANCGQRLVGKFGDQKEAGYVLESLPSRLPERAGEFALSLDGRPPSLVTVDYLDDKAWVKVCKRAAQLRAGAGNEAPAPATVVDRVESRPVLALAPPPVVGEGLVDEVVAILEEDRQLAPTELFDRLSPATRMAVGNVRAMGVELSLHWTVVTRGYDKRGRVWRLAEHREEARR